MLQRLLLASSLFLGQVSLAADTYNPSNNQLSIPSVEVAGTTYSNVLITVGSIVSVNGGVPKALIDSYDPALNQLHISSVQVGDVTYTNVVITVGQLLSVGSGSVTDKPPTSPTVIWRQTSNTIALSNDVLSALSEEGFTSYDFDGQGIKSFFFPPGANSWSYPRLPTDPDFQLFQFGAGNRIVAAPSPLATPYIAGHVNDDVLSGKFLADVEQSLIFIDHGREPQDRPYAQWEKSYLWRIDKSNGRWSVVEFAQDLGRQFWHSSSNPLDINGDGLLDFSVAALDSAVNYLFISNGRDFDKVRLADFMSAPENNNCGASALIRLANDRYGSICLPYTSPNSKGDTGYVFRLSTTGKTVESVQQIKVRNIPETEGMDPGEGYHLIRVVDLNGDGLDDFLAHAEFAKGGNSKTRRMLAFLQNKDSEFVVAPASMGLGPVYSLNFGNTDTYVDWVQSKSVLSDINGDGKTDLAIPTSLTLHRDLVTKGIQAGLIWQSDRYTTYTISPSKIVLNALPKPYSYRYVLPAELNGDGIIDFVLVGTFFDQTKTPTNIYGQRFEVSMLLSER